jgi:succinate dehydrogenase cytochrome b556 subunit
MSATTAIPGLRTTLEGSLRYRGREGQWAYVLNRVSGLATLLFLAIHILDTATVYFLPSLYDHAIALYRSTPFMVGEIGLVAAVLFHGLNGYKIIYFDLRPSRWTERNQARAFWWVLGLSVALWLPAAFSMGRSLYLNNICRCPPPGSSAFVFPGWADPVIVLALAASAVVLLRAARGSLPSGGVRPNLETGMWLFMRGSGILLVPLVWIHVLINDVLVGVHAIDLDYVALRWATLGWQAYDIALLGFTFAHGIYGLRGVLLDYVHSDVARRRISYGLLGAWVVWTVIGGIAIVAGVRAE